VSDLEAENYTTQGVDKSDAKSDTKSDVNLTWELSNDCQKSSNEDSVGNSVNLTDNMTVGGVCSDPGVSDSTVTLTPDNAIAHDPWEEKYIATNVDADGWGEIVRKEEAIAPMPLEQLNSTSADESGEAIAPPPPEEKYTPAIVDVDELLPPVRVQTPAIPVGIESEAVNCLQSGKLPQTIAAKPAGEAMTAADDEWQVGDHVTVNIPDGEYRTLQPFHGRQGIITKVKENSAQCLLDFGGDEFMHIPFRGLRRG
jgi:hypothetical protein